MAAHSSPRSAGGTMTWASSRRLVITNDIPQIVTSGVSSPRSSDRATATILSSPYSLRNFGSTSARGGFQPGKCCSNAYTSRNAPLLQRGGGVAGANYYTWRGCTNATSNRTGGTTVPFTTYYRGASIFQNRANFLPRSVPTTIAAAARSQQVETNPPKYFPLSQNVTQNSTQLAENLMPVTFPCQFQMRRMIKGAQPVVARRDVRFPTPTPIVVSRNTPIGIVLPRERCEAITDSERIAIKSSDADYSLANEAHYDEGGGDEENGRTSPDVLSTSIRSNEDSWDFWDRVYSDPELRQSMQERQRDSPMAEILHSDKLCKAQVVFLNVPRLAYANVMVGLMHTFDRTKDEQIE
ncbi:hypothetical protein DICVIV_09040 [Dictyocaulus viviparus]|uniref:Uncharacterized protein n=1 Tax=Dictyocaulus viviparus TaxID=29172 RepID=A0A0D8XME5_DICVI|nr:hypothetical protein DICVIV_09040 [Dictyocaulus viviparus]